VFEGGCEKNVRVWEQKMRIENCVVWEYGKGAGFFMCACVCVLAGHILLVYINTQTCKNNLCPPTQTI
jgi:hypothetical protein